MRILTSLEGSSASLFTGNIKISTLGAFGVENLYVEDLVIINKSLLALWIFHGFLQEEESGPEAEFETVPGAGSGVGYSMSPPADNEEDSLSVKSF